MPARNLPNPPKTTACAWAQHPRPGLWSLRDAAWSEGSWGVTTSTPYLCHAEQRGDAPSTAAFLHTPPHQKLHYQGQLGHWQAPILAPPGHFWAILGAFLWEPEARHHSRSCPVRTSRGRAACGAAVPCAPARSTWPAPPGTARATARTSTELSCVPSPLPRGHQLESGSRGRGRSTWGQVPKRSCRGRGRCAGHWSRWGPCYLSVATGVQDFPFLPLLGLPAHSFQPEDAPQ